MNISNYLLHYLKLPATLFWRNLVCFVVFFKIIVKMGISNYINGEHS
jgi:hypothetical protein